MEGGAKGLSLLLPFPPSPTLSLRLKSHCSCELFSPLIPSLSYKMKKGYRVRVCTRDCVHIFVCVCVRGGRLHTGSETMGASRPSQQPERSATATPAGTHQREQEKSHSTLKQYFTLDFFCPFLCRRSLVPPALIAMVLSCRTSAPSPPLSSPVTPPVSNLPPVSLLPLSH